MRFADDGSSNIAGGSSQGTLMLVSICSETMFHKLTMHSVHLFRNVCMYQGG